MHSFGIAALLALMNASQPSSASVDACMKEIPKSLVAQLHKRHPEFRPVHASDYSQEDLDFTKTLGSSCPGVAVADVDGNGLPDMALFITAKNGHTLLVAARKLVLSKWRVVTLLDFGNNGVSKGYVEPMNAGSYTDLFASKDAPSDYIPEPGRTRRYRSRHAGFLAGTMESTGAAFFFTGKNWVHLWLLD